MKKATKPRTAKPITRTEDKQRQAMRLEKSTSNKHARNIYKCSHSRTPGTDNESEMESTSANTHELERAVQRADRETRPIKNKHNTTSEQDRSQ